MTSTPPKTSAIILNWNGMRFLKDCLDSIRSQFNARSDLEVILVDNGSIDDSIIFVKNNYPFVKIVSIPNNVGICKALNIGIKESNGKYIALLNNDLILLPGWFTELEKELDHNDETGFCASKMTMFNSPEIIDSAGNGFRDFITYAIGHMHLNNSEYLLAKRVFGACAGAAMYRRKLFDDVGCFDEGFFINCEDNDLSFRANLMGYKCKYIPSAEVLHHHSGTIGNLSYTAVFYSIKNSMHLITKNIPTCFIIQSFPKLVFSLFKLSFIYVFAGKTKYCWKSYAAFFLETQGMLLKRIKIQSSIKIPKSEIENILRDRLKN